MDIKVEYKGQSNSKITISSLGEIRVKIAEKDRAIEKDIVEFAKSKSEELGEITFTHRQNVRTENGKIL